MTQMKDFKTIADRNMEEIKVTSELKAQTLRRLHKKPSSTRFLVPVLAAASLVFILGIAFWPGNLQGEKDSILNEPQMMRFQAESDTLYREPRITPLMMKDETIWNVDTPKEAEELFGAAFLMPSLLPSGYELDSITGTGTDNTLDRVTLLYKKSATESDMELAVTGKTIEITQHKVALPWEYSGYEVLDLSGYVGYLNLNDYFSEIHFFIGNTHYSIVGSLDKTEIIDIAKSMIKDNSI